MSENESQNKRNKEIEEGIYRQFSDLLKLFEKTAVRYQRLNLVIRLSQTLLAGALPFLIETTAPKALLVCLSAALAVLITSSQVWQFDSKWRQYLLVAFELRRELYMFLEHAGEYSDEETASRVSTFHRRTDKLLNSEFSPWLLIKPSERVS
jgi:hypothetical protein